MSKWREEREKEALANESKKKSKKAEAPTLEEFEEGMAADLDSVHESFRARTEKENKRFADVCDSNYYFVVCFSNNAQMVEFCDMLGLNPDEIYMDGRQVARKIGRALKTPDTAFPKIQPFGKDYVQRARTKE